jgi:hypothetical protein
MWLGVASLAYEVCSRWYMESSYPTEVAHHIFKLGQTHGHAKISYTLMSKVRVTSYAFEAPS